MEEDEADRRVRSGFEELCSGLNMDEEASSDAWSRFRCISNTFTLEGSELHWLACSLYSSCRSSVPTVGNGTSEGNYVSLTRLLRCANMSVMEFFRKMRKWQDMADLPPDFRRGTERLERSFAVSAVLFQKFVPIFRSVFRTPSEEPPRVHRGRKQRRQPCSVNEVFNFCWLLFILAKGNFPLVGDDLVNSFHLLLCSVDLVFSNALLSHARKDLLNPHFSGLPADFSSPDFRPPGCLCVLQPLCERHDGLMLEAKGVKEHFWKPLIRRLFHRRILRGKEDSLTGVLDPINFGDSFLSLSRLYEDHVLASGGLDERIFTGDGAGEDIGTPGLHLCDNQEGAPPTSTALRASRRCWPDLSPASPLWGAMRSAGRLHTLLSGSKQGASARLEETLRKCSRDPSAAMDRRLSAMLDLLTQHYGAADTKGLIGKDEAVRCFHLAVALYYRTLESIMEREKTILGDADLSVLLEQDVFHRSLLACCFQVVVFSVRPPGDFPNVLAAFRLPAFHFYKVIEVMVRSEHRLFREVVKHLNQVEERVLESLAWTSDSPLWESLRGDRDRAPPCQEVTPPQYLEQSDPGGCDPKGVPPSPHSLSDRYSSPPASSSSSSSSARRRLFMDPPGGGVGSVAKATQQPAAVVAAIPAGQTVVTMATATVTANNGQTVTIPVQGIANESGGITFIPVQVSVTGPAAAAKPPAVHTLTGTLVQPAAAKPVAKATGSPLRKGSVSLFFRKVYQLASVRVRSLCVSLALGPQVTRKVWTCLEFSLVNFPLMLKDRHLDQLILCAVYVVAKVTKEERSFQNIMRCYRSQPQACSDVYRNVLISNGRSPSDRQDAAGGDVSPAPLHSNSTSSTPIKNSSPPSSSSSSPTAGEEERGDLIHFYNKVYIKQMRQFALRYSPSSPSAGAPPLCPFPTLRTGSPRRMLLSSRHSIYISPHKTGSAPSASTPPDKIHSYVCGSPPTRLQEINQLLLGQTPSRKRLLSLDVEAPVKRLCPENHGALVRRLQDVADDRGSSSR